MFGNSVVSIPGCDYVNYSPTPWDVVEPVFQKSNFVNSQVPCTVPVTADLQNSGVCSTGKMLKIGCTEWVTPNHWLLAGNALTLPYMLYRQETQVAFVGSSDNGNFIEAGSYDTVEVNSRDAIEMPCCWTCC